jgi:lipid II:glycine glycyltransferase (peptidoglycan interpeptide bridge formation enzyme)
MGGIASMCLFLYDKKRAYYLLAANDPTHRSTGAATRLMFDNIFEAKRRGLQELDFVGVNSPNRGDFKLSFNPELKLYFDVSYGEAICRPREEPHNHE